MNQSLKSSFPLSRLVLLSIFSILSSSAFAQQENDIANDIPAKRPLVVGMSAAFTGPSRGLSIELYRGSMAYLKHINESGGVHDTQVVILPYDDGYNPIPATENTIQLIERDKAFLLFDYMGSATVTRVLPLLKRFQKDRPIYLFFPFTGAEPMRQPPYNEFVFNLRASYQQETGELVDKFVALGRKRIAVFYQVDAYGRSGWNGTRLALAKYTESTSAEKTGSLGDGPIFGGYELRMVAEATYRRGTPFDHRFHEQVEILRQAKPDAVISIATYSAAAGFIRDARDAGWDIPIANISGVDSENMLKLLMATEKATGKDYTRDLLNTQIVPSYLDSDLPAAKQYRELMDRYQPQPPPDLLDSPYDEPRYSYISFEGFLNAKLLVEILQRLGSPPDASRLPEVVESIKELDLGIDVPVSFAPDRHQGLNKVYFTVASEGQFIPLLDEKWEQWRK